MTDPLTMQTRAEGVAQLPDLPDALRPTPHARWLQTFVILALAAAAAAALLVRVPAIAEPLGIDQSLWASAVRGMARGQRLYVDVWEQRPPGIYWIYLAAFRAFGWAQAAIAWLDILAAAATTLLLFVIGRRLSGTMAGVVAAALYATLTIPAGFYSHHSFLERSVCETFMTVAIGFAAWFAVRFVETPAARHVAGVGLFAGAAIVLKPNAGLYLPALLLWIAVCSGRLRGWRVDPAFQRPLRIAGLAACVVPAIAVVWLWQLGALHEAAIAVIEFNRFYVGQGLSLSGLALAFSKAVWLRMKTDPLWAAGAIGAAAAVWQLARRRQLPPLAALAVLWGGAAVLVILVNGIRLFNSYFIQAFAPLALLAAWLLVDFARGSYARKALGAGTVSLMVVLLATGQYPVRVFRATALDLDYLNGRIDRTSYLDRFGGYANHDGYSARANAELAEYVRDHTDPQEKIFLFGISGAGVYFGSDRLAAHRFLRVNFFVPSEFSDPRFRLSAVLRELASRKPRYLIFERLHTRSEMGRTADRLPMHGEVLELLEGYEFDKRIEDFMLYRRTD